MAHGGERVVRMRRVGTTVLDGRPPVRLTSTGASVTVTHGRNALSCERPDGADGDWLESVVGTSRYLAELVACTPDVEHPEVLVRVLVFDYVLHWEEPRSVGVDEFALDAFNSLAAGRHRGISEVGAWLDREFMVRSDEDESGSYFVISAQGGSLNDTAFRIVGSRLVADLRLDGDRLMVQRATARRGHDELAPILVQGDLRFVDESRASVMTALARQETRRLAEADNAYLAIWNEYNQLEREAARSAARAIGAAEFDQRDLLPDGRVEFHLVRHLRSDALLRQLNDGMLGLEAGEGVAFGQDFTGRTLIGEASLGASGETVVVRPARPVGEDDLPRRGMLAGAYTLDRVRIDRRDVAQEAMRRGGRFPLHQMGLFLADERPAPLGRVRKERALSPRVLKILGGRPTEAQERAIELAINSKDVVLIQGPPGTGKTRVIAAIQARLTEINKNVPPMSKRVLLTSYQHDAVANLVHAADDGTLPAVKLGRADGQEDESYLIAWTHDLHERLERRYADVVPSAIVRARIDLERRTTAYREQPFDVRSTVGLLRWLAEQDALIGPELTAEASRAAQHLDRELGPATSRDAWSEGMRLVRALRTTPEGQADDGPARAEAVVADSDLRRRLSARERTDLRSVADGTVSQQAARAISRQVKDELLDRMLRTRARAGVVAALPEVGALLQRAAAAADAEVDRATTPIDRAVEAFREAVESRPGAVRASILRHTRALAATCQQSVSGSVRSAHQSSFDTVIVDEAARANPLDLLIPVTLAENRVILVGDHRQLPQLLDDRIVPELSARHRPDVVDAVLNRSLFERLFLALQKEERRGGSTRVVTLDRQFRMHPVLGTFISEQFYAPHNEPLNNAIKDSAPFVHGLERYADAACAWLDVRGHSEERVGKSIRRTDEARVIVDELEECLRASTDLTFGVITFYSGQVDAFNDLLLARGLGVRTDAGVVLNANEPWLFDARGLPRVRVGTVDAFQGREFDVVFLSTTRSTPPNTGRRRPYGFLVLPNRLCVAMSRQRRLLVTVGDAGMFTSEAGRAAVPWLAAFHDLTGGDHGLRRAVD